MSASEKPRWTGSTLVRSRGAKPSPWTPATTLSMPGTIAGADGILLVKLGLPHSVPCRSALFLRTPGWQAAQQPPLTEPRRWGGYSWPSDIYPPWLPPAVARRSSSIRHRAWRLGSVRLAQEAEIARVSGPTIAPPRTLGRLWASRPVAQHHPLNGEYERRGLGGGNRFPGSPPMWSPAATNVHPPTGGNPYSICLTQPLPSRGLPQQCRRYSTQHQIRRSEC